MFRVPAYRALRVLDGDTFETTDKLRIRLLGVDAPEVGRCGSQEAKNELEKLVMNRNLEIRVKFVDSGKRLVSNVYTQAGLVEELMAKTGWVMNDNKATGEVGEQIDRAFEIPKTKEIGIFSKKCSQTINEKKPKCIIKGNINLRYKTKYYSFPGCSNYNRLIVQLATGDQWFCSEKEALVAGFNKSGDCFGKSWK